jgi:hypothetical protein
VKRVAGILVGFGAFALACASSSTAPPESTSGALGALPCDVNQILVDNCQKCHAATPSFGAPIPLVTLADLRANAKLTPGKKVFEQIGVRIHDDASPMPQPPNARLGAADLATLDAWIAGGAPAGTATCGDAGTAPTTIEALTCSPDQILRPTSKFTLPKDQTDVYVCYGFDTNAATKRHVIAGAPHIDNTKIVHHVLLYQTPDTVSGTPTPCGAGGGSNWRLVTGWAPGGKNFALPAEAGFAEESGTTHWALQIHYNNVQALDGEEDASGYDLCSTDQLRPNDADIMATGTFEISLPQHTTSQIDCDVTMPSGYGSLNVVSTWAHMHKLGRAESAARVRNGISTPLLDAPNYDFNTGAGAQTVNVLLQGGDTIHTMCRWTNTTDATVGFGERTQDEMCFAFLTYYPKVTTPGFIWAAPSAPSVSKCSWTPAR